jgi:hypothetical protein
MRLPNERTQAAMQGEISKAAERYIFFSLRKYSPRGAAAVRTL